jgi:transposase
MQTLHRARDRLVGERTALMNQLRAILMERGIVVPQGRRKLERQPFTLIDEKEAVGLSPRVVKLIEDMQTQWSELDRRIEEFDKAFAAFAKVDEDARLLVSIPGIGVTIASALIAAIGTAETFARGRDLAAWLGLIPKQSSTGGKPRLFGISKRGNKYLRKLPIHGARSALPHLAERATPLGRWTKGLAARAHKNIAVVALANKLARIAWAVLRRRARFAVGESPVAA